MSFYRTSEERAVYSITYLVSQFFVRMNLNIDNSKNMVMDIVYTCNVCSNMNCLMCNANNANVLFPDKLV